MSTTQVTTKAYAGDEFGVGDLVAFATVYESGTRMRLLHNPTWAIGTVYEVDLGRHTLVLDMESGEREGVPMEHLWVFQAAEDCTHCGGNKWKAAEEYEEGRGIDRIDAMIQKECCLCSQDTGRD